TLAVRLMGDAIYANPLLLGYAWQKGWIPLSHQSLIRAIELNGVKVEENLSAFEWGRAAAHHGTQSIMPDAGKAAAQVVPLPESLDKLIERNTRWLTAYQDTAYADRYLDAVNRIRQVEASLLTARG